ncbi:stalk domain-containing protein [Paenibacillus tengchongensis]|uniref:stalk domain-containing protein n=1 Tax=Paenibacillus tengchongensis TaxID=2608684 RepID=UPI00124CE19F|nr:stalk domain-containing protein [Paenibacillus tengchongensis]
MRALFIWGVTVILLITFASGTAGAAPSYRYVINETEEISGGMLLGGTHYIPLKEAFEKLVYDVEWSQKTRTAVMYTPGRTIQVKTETGQVQVDGVAAEQCRIRKRNGINMIAAKDVARLTGSRLTVEGTTIHIEGGQSYIFGKKGSHAFWVGNGGEVYGRGTTGAPVRLGEVNVKLNEWRYAKINIQPVTQTGSFVVTATSFSGEPLIHSQTVKVFIQNNRILHSAVSGGDEDPRTARRDGLWVFAEGGNIRYINDHGAVVQSYDLDKWLGPEEYKLEGFAGERLLLVRATATQILFVVDPVKKRRLVLYQLILGAEEQTSIEQNTDRTDMHYGDNLHLLSARDGVLTFSYFSYLQGAKESQIPVRIADLEQALAD